MTETQSKYPEWKRRAAILKARVGSPLLGVYVSGAEHLIRETIAAFESKAGKLMPDVGPFVEYVWTDIQSWNREGPYRTPFDQLSPETVRDLWIAILSYADELTDDPSAVASALKLNVPTRGNEAAAWRTNFANQLRDVRRIVRQEMRARMSMEPATSCPSASHDAEG